MTARLLPSGGGLHQDGAASGPPVLLLHGVGGGAWSWEPQRLALREGHRVFAWEARGHGTLPPVADASLADYHRDAAEALALVHAQTGQPVLLAGHSMGGLLALALACERPVAVAGLFLVDPVYAERGDAPLGPGLARAVLRRVMGAVVRSFQRDGWLARALAWRFFAWAFHHAARRDAAWASQRKQVPVEYPTVLLESVDGVQGFPFRAFADVLEVPVCLVEALPRPGASSRFAALAARLRARLGERLQHERLVGGHYLQLDCPAEVSALLARFAAGCAPRRE